MPLGLLVSNMRKQMNRQIKELLDRREFYIVDCEWTPSDGIYLRLAEKENSRSLLIDPHVVVITKETWDNVWKKYTED